MVSRIAAIGLALALGVSACGPTAPQASSAQPAQAQATQSAAAATSQPTATPVKLDKAILGTVRSITNLQVDIAIARGYFKEQGIDLEVKYFATGVDIVPALATNQLDIGEGSVTPALYNSMARGIKLSIVGQKAACGPGMDFCPLVVGKQLLDSGKWKDWTSIRGRKIAVSNLFTGSHQKLVILDEQFGVKASEYEIVTLPFDQMGAAMAAGAIDAAVVIEPTATALESKAIGKRILDGKHSPYVLVTLITYSEKFSKDRADVGSRYMAAYLKGARDLVKARSELAAGRPGLWDAITKLPFIPTDYPALADPATKNTVSIAYVDPDARVDEKQLKATVDWYDAAGKLTDGQPKLADAVDQRFVTYAVGKLGPYQK